MALLTTEHLQAIGTASDPVSALVTRRDIIKYSISTEQIRPAYLSGDEAPPMFVVGLFSVLQPLDRYRPDGIPRAGTGGLKLPLKRVMAGGTKVRQHRPIRPGDTLVGVSVLTDLYEKQGRSGPLIFSVREFKIATEDGVPVADQISTTIAR